MHNLVKPAPWSKFCGGQWYRWPLGLEWLAEWILYYFQRLALIKLAVNGTIAASVVVGIVLFTFEVDDRETDRAARRATMLATIFQVAGTAKNKEAVNPVVPILETLLQQKINLSGLPLPGANLSKANLSGANLSDANLSKANLSGADLNGADLSYADLSSAINLIQRQLDTACKFRDNSVPKLPDGFNALKNVCKR